MPNTCPKCSTEYLEGREDAWMFSWLEKDVFIFVECVNCGFRMAEKQKHSDNDNAELRRWEELRKELKIGSA